MPTIAQDRNAYLQADSPEPPHRPEPLKCSRKKDIADRMAAAALLLPSIPIIAVLIVFTRLSSRGPGIFRQSRVGHGGKVFTVYKIRTMRRDAEVKSGPVWSSKNDYRVTVLGRIMRKLHLDELPQLFNVIKGEMSLVGPRPERPEFVQELKKKIPQYDDRLRVKPGITGLAQINLLPDTALDDARRKQCLDVEYIRTMSLPLDVRIIACTALRVLGIRGRAINQFLGVDQIELVDAEFPPQARSTFTTSPNSLSPDSLSATSSFPPLVFEETEEAADRAVQWLTEQGFRASVVPLDSVENIHERVSTELDNANGDDVILVVVRAPQTGDYEDRSFSIAKPR